MALPDVTKQRAKQRLTTFCKSRIPARVRHQVRLKYATRGDTVTLFEERPAFRDRTRWVRLQIAQFRFDTDHLKWSLDWADRKRRWHLCARWQVSSLGVQSRTRSGANQPRQFRTGSSEESQCDSSIGVSQQSPSNLDRMSGLKCTSSSTQDHVCRIERPAIFDLNHLTSWSDGDDNPSYGIGTHFCFKRNRRRGELL